MLIHANTGDLLRSLEPDTRLTRPTSLAMNREGYVVVNYDRGDLCLFGINGKLLKHTRHQDVIQVCAFRSVFHCLAWYSQRDLHVCSEDNVELCG